MSELQITEPLKTQSVYSVLKNDLELKAQKVNYIMQKYSLELQANGAIKIKGRLYINNIETLKMFIQTILNKESVSKFINRKCSYIKGSIGNFIYINKIQLLQSGAKYYGQILYVENEEMLEKTIISIYSQSDYKTHIALISYLDQMHFNDIKKTKLFIRIYRKKLKELGVFYSEEKQYPYFCFSEIDKIKALVKEYLNLNHRN